MKRSLGSPRNRLLVLMAGVALAAACEDTTLPHTKQDRSVRPSLVSGSYAVQVTLFEAAGMRIFPLTTRSVTHDITDGGLSQLQAMREPLPPLTRVTTGRAFGTRVNAVGTMSTVSPTATQKEPVTISGTPRQRDATGRYTVLMQSSKDAGAPAAITLILDSGRVVTAFEADWKNIRGKWFVKKSRMTSFDRNGKQRAEVKKELSDNEIALLAAPSGMQSLARRAVAVLGPMLAPSGLYARTIDGETCTVECAVSTNAYAGYLVAQGGYQFAIVQCLINPLGLDCLSLAGRAEYANLQLTKYVEAQHVCDQCKASSATTGGGSSGSGTGGTLGGGGTTGGSSGSGSGVTCTLVRGGDTTEWTDANGGIHIVATPDTWSCYNWTF